MGAFSRQWNTTTLPGNWAKCPLGCSVLLPVVFNLKLHGAPGRLSQQQCNFALVLLIVRGKEYFDLRFGLMVY